MCSPPHSPKKLIKIGFDFFNHLDKRHGRGAKAARARAMEADAPKLG
jgi:hypothetical protein